jgi:hypothetical protein
MHGWTRRMPTLEIHLGSFPENSVAAISNIMGQTVALDTYNDTVDDFLANFAPIQLRGGPKWENSQGFSFHDNGTE